MNQNEIEKNSITQDQLDALFARNNAQSIAEREARQRAAEWPHEIEQLISALVARYKAQAEDLAAIHTRLAKVEAATGIGQG